MKIISVVANNPIFVELQYNSIKKYVKNADNIEFIIFNDAKNWKDITNFGDATMRSQIEDICKKLNITCINIPNDHHMYNAQASKRHADSVNFITKFIMKTPDKYFMLDCDMFFIDNIDLSVFDKYYFVYVEQERTPNNIIVKYPWPNLFLIDTNRVPHQNEINWNTDHGLDSGGKNALWLSLLDKNMLLKLSYLSSCNWTEKDLPTSINKKLLEFLNNDIRNVNGKFFAEIYNDNILHYRAGSNWMNNSIAIHDNLTKKLKITLDNMINDII